MENFIGKNPAQVLKSVFGYDSFRPLQREIIESVLAKNDTLAIMPTGGGKSLCYQIPALIIGGITVVVSPLISLMQDQYTQLENSNIPAAVLNSALDWSEYENQIQKIRRGKIRIVYISPEGLSTPRVSQLLSSADVRLVAVDEAHCVSQWGHDFRPDYLEIANIRKFLKNAVFLALTATATKNVQDDIAKNLKLQNPKFFLGSFNRPNIFISVRKKEENAIEQIFDFVNQHKNESGIVYCFSKKDTETISDALCRKGISALPYHAGLSAEIRAENQRRFIFDEVQVIAATLAFGMGINKPNVRFVIHHSMPKSIEQYYQEIGRAGRDGLPAEAVLFHSASDALKIRKLLSEDAVLAGNHFSEMQNFISSQECRRKSLLSYFGESFVPKPCKDCCDLCALGESELQDLTIPAQKLMSCIVRTGARFGESYVINVLRGSKQKRILENSHDKLSTYGIGFEFDADGWKSLSASLISSGILMKSGEFHILSLTKKGAEILRNRQKIELAFRIKPLKEGLSKKRAKIPSGSEKSYTRKTFDFEGDEKAARIFEDLRKWRLAMAKSLGVAPFIVMHDRTFLEIAFSKPQSLEDLRDCQGMPSAKMSRYGSEILQIVRGV